MRLRNPVLRGAITAVLAALLSIPIADSAPSAAGPGAIYARIDIDSIGPGPLREVKDTPGLVWWIELDDRLLVLADEPALAALERQLAVERLAFEPRQADLYLLRGVHAADLAAADLGVLAVGGRFAVIQGRRGERPDLPTSRGAGETHSTLLPFTPNLVLARQLANQARPPLAPVSPSAALIDEVDQQRWFDAVVALADYNRWTMGSEIDAARDWLVLQLEALPGFAVTTESFSVGGAIGWNVIGTLPGSVRPDDLYIVGGHYDATSQLPHVAAPGAEDNASGCAGVLEMARIFAANPPEATVLFICYSGEEQGLYGSTDHASGLVAAGLDDQVMAVLIMDMVGYTADADLDCLLETSAANSTLLEAFAAAAQLTELRIVLSFNPFGSDHVPYLNRGMPALLAIENDWNQYSCYHDTCDLPANLTLAMAREILRMNVVAIGEMIGTGKIFSDDFESGDISGWSSTVQ